MLKILRQKKIMIIFIICPKQGIDHRLDKGCLWALCSVFANSSDSLKLKTMINGIWQSHNTRSVLTNQGPDLGTMTNHQPATVNTSTPSAGRQRREKLFLHHCFRSSACWRWDMDFLASSIYFDFAMYVKFWNKIHRHLYPLFYPMHFKQYLRSKVKIQIHRLANL